MWLYNDIPHTQGEEKTGKRKQWEWMHKGSGYACVALAFINIWIGGSMTKWMTEFFAAYAVAILVPLLILGYVLFRDGRKSVAASHETNLD